MNKAGQAREDLANIAGSVAVIGLTLLSSTNALYKQTRAYGDQETIKLTVK